MGEHVSHKEQTGDLFWGGIHADNMCVSQCTPRNETSPFPPPLLRSHIALSSKSQLKSQRTFLIISH